MKKTLKIEGMSCKHCVAHVTEALAGVPGVESAQVSLESKSAVVLGPALDEAAMKAAVADAGYEVVAVE